MRKLLVFILVFTLSKLCLAQSLSVRSHYPASAFVTQRFIPFSVQGSGMDKILSVKVESGSSCSAMLDPYYKETFHIYCENPERFDLQVIVKDVVGTEYTLGLQKINVLEQSPPTDSLDQGTEVTREVE